MPSWRVVDEWEGGFGWLAEERMQRTSHALRVDGRLWLVDPVDVDGIRDRLDDVAGVIQLLDRHTRDGHAFGVPVQRAWERLDAPFDAVPVRHNRFWKEVALWEPVSRTLVCADALGTIDYFRAPGERIGWHPLVRPSPPHAFAALAPERVLVGHGEGVFEGASDAVADLVANGRRRTAQAWLNAVRTTVRVVVASR